MTATTPHGFDAHDHSQCQATAMATAEAACRTRGLQLTPMRRRVLEILLEGHKAMGAYEILDILCAEGANRQPPIVYRALDFLVREGFAHRIERLNAFVACSHGGTDHAPFFLICRTCDRVAEAQADLGPGNLGKAASTAGFQVERLVVEAEGQCAACQSNA